VLIAFVINAFLVALAVVLHYEVLYQLASRLPNQQVRPRLRVLTGVFIILFTHIVEIWLFAVAYYFMIHNDGFGALSGNIDQSLLDCSYYSFTSYTTLGFGDIVPAGHIRFLTGLESLTGLVLITWSASFLFLEMQRYWPKR